MRSRASLLGLNGYVDGKRIDALVESLSAIWRLSMARDLGELESDLDLCRRWFDPVAQGQRLRRELAAVPRLPDALWDPGHPFTLAVGAMQCLVTPEGRCVVDLLVHLDYDRKGHVIKEALR